MVFLVNHFLTLPSLLMEVLVEVSSSLQFQVLADSKNGTDELKIILKH